MSCCIKRIRASLNDSMSLSSDTFMGEEYTPRYNKMQNTTEEEIGYVRNQRIPTISKRQRNKYRFDLKTREEEDLTRTSTASKIDLPSTEPVALNYVDTESK